MGVCERSGGYSALPRKPTVRVCSSHQRNIHETSKTDNRMSFGEYCLLLLSYAHYCLDRVDWEIIWPYEEAEIEL